MQEYVARWEKMNAQLASMDSPNEEGLLFKMFSESFEGMVELVVCNRPLSAANERRLHMAAGHFAIVTGVQGAINFRACGDTSQKKALTAQQSNNKNKARGRFSGNGVEC